MASHMGQSEKEQRGARGARRVAAIAAGVIVAVALLAYLAGVIAFNVVFMPGTVLDGQDVSLRPASEVAAEKADAFAGYQLSVTGDGVELTISADQISLSYDGDSYARDAIAATNPWAWPLAFASQGPRDVSVESAVVFDRDALLALFDPFVESARASAEELAGGAVVFDAEAEEFSLDQSVLAQYLDDDALVKSLTSAFADHAGELTLDDAQLSRTDDALHTALDTANSYLAAAGSALTLDGQTAAEVTADDISGWLTFSDDLSVSVNTDAVTSWVSDRVASLDTVGAERTYTRADGKQVSVSGGRYGWKVSAGDAASALASALEQKTPQQIEVPFEQRGEVIPDAGGRDWGPRYLDIDLSEQHVRMYGDDGTLVWESDCVTGQPSSGFGTPTGVYQINSNMTRDTVLIGLDYNDDGEPDYKTPVSYWMPFIDNMVALHDLSGRSRFGGDIYKWNGSHGCVNLPTDKAAALYGILKVGDVVVVHN